MLHVFYVHSYVPALIAEAIIRDKKLTRDDVLIWNCRNNGRPWLEWEVPVVDLDTHPFRRPVIEPSWNPLKTRKLLHVVDQSVYDQVAGRPYHLYLPHSLNQFFQLASTHPLCRSVSYLEEGLAAYRSNAGIVASLAKTARATNSVSYVQRLLLANRIQWRTLDFFNSFASMAYGITDLSFSRVALPRRILPVAWRRDVELAAKFDGSMLLLVAPLNDVESTTSERRAHLDALRELGRLFGEVGFDKVFVRPHPADDRESVRQILSDCFDLGGGPFILDESSFAPEVVAASADVQICSAGSSSAVYAQLWGRKVYTYAPLWARRSQDYDRRLSLLLADLALPSLGVDVAVLEDR